jgi:hypothetical protein
MPKLSALIHVHGDGDARSLGRALEALRPCDEVLVIDHSHSEHAKKAAREYGAALKEGIAGVDEGAYAFDCQHRWILCVLPNEGLSEGLEAALFEWKQSDPPAGNLGYKIAIREETREGWRPAGLELRLVNRDCMNWTGRLPGESSQALFLTGDLLRFSDSEPS